MLDVIYTEYIKCCVHFGKTPPSFYIEKRNKNNQQKLEALLIDEAINSVLFELYRSQNFGKTSFTALEKLNTSIQHLEQKKELKNNILFKSKLFIAVSQLLISKKDFKTLEVYSLKTYKEFLEKKQFTQNNHDFKLQLLRYICNSLFMNKKHNEALTFCHVFYTSMQEHKGFLFDANVFFYYNAIANNYSVLDTQKAIDVLNEAKNSSVINNHPHFLGYIYLNLAGAYFDLKQPKLAIKNIIKIYHHKFFEILNPSFKLQIIIIDLLLRVEINQIEFVNKQIDIVIKNHHKTLKLQEHVFDLIFLKLLKKLGNKYQFQKNTSTLKLTSSFIKKTKGLNENKIINYHEWLKEYFS